VNFDNSVPVPYIPTTADIIAANITANKSAPLSIGEIPAAFTITRNNMMGTKTSAHKIDSSSIQKIQFPSYKKYEVCA
jgi:hypothetical protein